MTVIARGGGDCGEVAGRYNLRLWTHTRSVKPLNIFRETSGKSPAVLVATKGANLKLNMIFYNHNQIVFVSWTYQAMSTVLSWNKIENWA